MRIAGLVTPVSSDFLLFDPYGRCVACDCPAQHWARGTQHHPVLAGGVISAGGGFRQLAVLCSACVSATTLEQCLWAARRRAERPSAVCFVYQLVGSRAVRAQVQRFVESLQQYSPSAPHLAIPDAPVGDALEGQG